MSFILCKDITSINLSVQTGISQTCPALLKRYNKTRSIA